LPEFFDPNLLVGFSRSDDAAVYKLNDETAVIQTLDFFTPVVDDPFTFGQIAAANSLSDVYAMGGEPVLALNIVCFPNCLALDVMKEILLGGADKVKEAGALLVGGHTVQDDEPKYGLSVMGLVHPDRVVTNSGAKPGDLLILTKPLGSGIINTAIKAGLADMDTYSRAVDVMRALNREGAKAMAQVGVSGCTDITGFGLMGHCFEMAEASRVTLEIWKDRIPIIQGAIEFASMGLIPGGAYLNKNYLKGKVQLKNVDLPVEDVIFDPQTSGGLLIALQEDKVDRFMDILNPVSKFEIMVVGRVREREEFAVVVV
jgi:selenide,water dikinase